jgi:hypothetical protein
VASAARVAASHPQLCQFSETRRGTQVSAWPERRHALEPNHADLGGGHAARFRAVRPRSNRSFAGTSHAGGGTRTPDTRIMIPRCFGSTRAFVGAGGQKRGHNREHSRRIDAATTSSRRPHPTLRGAVPRCRPGSLDLPCAAAAQSSPSHAGRAKRPREPNQRRPRVAARSRRR